MLEKTKTTIITYIKSLSDLRVVGQSFFVIIVLLLSWSGVKAIQTNYELQKKISRLEQEIEIQKLENDNLRLSNQYLETDQFLELAARRQFGRAAPGEKLLIVPENIAKRYISAPIDGDETKQPQAKKPSYQQNLEDWVNFFFRKSRNNLVES